MISFRSSVKTVSSLDVLVGVQAANEYSLAVILNLARTFGAHEHE